MQVDLARKVGWRFTRVEVADACRKWSQFLHNVPAGLDPAQLMWAFALNESIHEKGGVLNCKPRFEPAYWLGGRYCPKGSLQEELNTRFGKDGAKSYGNWQVMLCNTGFKPEDFARVEVGAQAFVAYMNNMLLRQKPTSLTQIADAYNSGNFRDKVVPQMYIDRLMQHYYEYPL